uniref:Uncharacterized protein n=1 Tax=Chromera velia CCMP2878 TaxID=1169474 RepID=A0A0G4HNZ3_9ALVE|eukprot:Cvel_7693.t1-p1 / transcript=Cvel_7693.t1 / gene=Cvel_7693 / organism=Chromera_velia_CCMP2878 / gene_product=hypothetical protein / transcript_product=hypothetical protein / location=Cvel_scaffold408:64367-66992(+) / protein_length=525 / sequence_SO=supercontig / SO=protein_coding / is_pseudo=false
MPRWLIFVLLGTFIPALALQGRGTHPRADEGPGAPASMATALAQKREEPQTESTESTSTTTGTTAVTVSADADVTEEDEEETIATHSEQVEHEEEEKKHEEEEKEEEEKKEDEEEDTVVEGYTFDGELSPEEVVQKVEVGIIDDTMYVKRIDSYCAYGNRHLWCGSYGYRTYLPTTVYEVDNELLSCIRPPQRNDYCYCLVKADETECCDKADAETVRNSTDGETTCTCEADFPRAASWEEEAPAIIQSHFPYTLCLGDFDQETPALRHCKRSSNGDHTIDPDFQWTMVEEELGSEGEIVFTVKLADVGLCLSVVEGTDPLDVAVNPCDETTIMKHMLWNVTTFPGGHNATNEGYSMFRSLGYKDKCLAAKELEKKEGDESSFLQGPIGGAGKKEMKKEHEEKEEESKKKEEDHEGGPKKLQASIFLTNCDDEDEAQWFFFTNLKNERQGAEEIERDEASQDQFAGDLQQEREEQKSTNEEVLEEDQILLEQKNAKGAEGKGAAGAVPSVLALLLLSIAHLTGRR